MRAGGGMSRAKVRALIAADPSVSTGWTRQSGPPWGRLIAGTNSAGLLSGRMTMSAVYLYAGDPITKLGYLAGATQIVAPVHQWFALYDPAGNLMRQTVNDGANDWVPQTVKSLALTSPTKALVTGWHYSGIQIVATTTPNLHGIASNAASAGLTPVQGGPANTGLTDTAPAVMAISGSAAVQPFVLVG
jgi:hypothetical protein